MSLTGNSKPRKRERNVPTFADVAGKDKTDNKGNSILDQFYEDPKKIEKKQVSIYLDVDVIEAFKEFGDIKGKGAKSDLVNNFLKQVFNIRQDEK